MNPYPPYQPKLGEWITAGPVTTDEIECIQALDHYGFRFRNLEAGLKWVMQRRKFRS